MDEINKFKDASLSNLKSFSLLANPVVDDKPDSFKFESLILFSGNNFNSSLLKLNKEEVTQEEKDDATKEKEERRKAAEEEARLKKEEEDTRLAEIALEQAERERLALEGEGIVDEGAVGGDEL